MCVLKEKCMGSVIWGLAHTETEGSSVSSRLLSARSKAGVLLAPEGKMGFGLREIVPEKCSLSSELSKKTKQTTQMSRHHSSVLKEG